MDRLCSTCNETKSLEEFYTDVAGKAVTAKVHCKSCIRSKAKESRAQLQRNTYKLTNGHIYMIKNDAWPTWCKIGFCTTTPEKRLQTYQTGTPFRDYYVRYSIEVDDVRKAETDIHQILTDAGFSKQSEWFEVDASIAIKILLNYRGTLELL